MSYLLDTNVLSELRRRQPDARVAAWFAKRPPGTLYLSVLTLGELRKGVEVLEDASRRLVLLDWLETELPAYFTGRVLNVDAAVADRWGRIVAQAGRPLPAIDSLLAATALQHGLILVTRNVRAVQGLSGLSVLNPWDALA
ncbi:type II toxin-antitoxin system VapC family toxin [Roseateles sp. DC23W]|uniref:Ribonuclease VapC n=1 Tax=Pelomonas dachongensis TaxID=3299029 RepID=A0ABW7EP37_9BURK